MKNNAMGHFYTGGVQTKASFNLMECSHWPTQTSTPTQTQTRIKMGSIIICRTVQTG